ncbi:MAG: Dabb family protein [Chlorobi bacterium]|nr:Dabb family protein [Chlorobiota bacterium]
MIKHIVFVKIKGAASDEEKLNDLQKLKDALDNLPSEIPEIKKYETGINISDSSTAYDLALSGDFESAEALDVYRNHPAHLKVLDLISSIKGRTAVVDYEY